MNLDPLSIVDILGKAGVMGILVLIIATGARRVWYFAWYVDELRARLVVAEQQRDKALYQAERSMGVADKVTP